MYNMEENNQIESKLFWLILDNSISTKDIIHELLWDQKLNLYIRKRATNTYNYMRHNVDKIIKNIEKPSWNFTADFLEKWYYSLEKQKFLYENCEIIENMIKGIWSNNIRENINILSRLLCTIIDDQYVVNLNQIKQF